MDNPAALANLRKSSNALSEVHRIEEIWGQDLASSNSQAGLRKGPVRHSLSSHLVGRLVAILSEFAAGPPTAPINYSRLLDAPPPVAAGTTPEPVNAADYFFIGLLNFYVSKRTDAFVPKILSLLHQQFPYLAANLAYAEGLLRTAVSLEPRHYWPHWVLGRTLLTRGIFRRRACVQQCDRRGPALCARLRATCSGDRRTMGERPQSCAAPARAGRFR